MSSMLHWDIASDLALAVRLHNYICVYSSHTSAPNGCGVAMHPNKGC